MEHIYVKMHGRLGNQLFRYATARCIQLRYGGELNIDFDRVYKEGSHKFEEKGFEDSLASFSVTEYKKEPVSVLNRGGKTNYHVCAFYDFNQSVWSAYKIV